MGLFEGAHNAVQYSVAGFLAKRGWTPSTDREKVHFLAALSKGAELRNQWDLTARVLFKDKFVLSEPFKRNAANEAANMFNGSENVLDKESPAPR